MSDSNLNEPVTKGMLHEAVDTLLKGMDNIFDRFKEEIAPIKDGVETLKKDMASVKSDITFIKRDIEDIKSDLSDTPSRREFNELKAKVEEHLQYHSS